MEDNVAHVESENVFLQPVFQVLEKSTSKMKAQPPWKRLERYTGMSFASFLTFRWRPWLQGAWRRATVCSEFQDIQPVLERAWSGRPQLSNYECRKPQRSPAQTSPKVGRTLGQPEVHGLAPVNRWDWNGTITSCNFLSSLLKLSSWPLLRTSGMSCQRAKAEPRDERKELDGDRLDGDGVPSEPSSLSPSSSWPGSFPCCLWISLLMATSLYSWYRMAAGKGQHGTLSRKYSAASHWNWLNNLKKLTTW